MGLRLIVGPPNSGRAGEISQRLRAALEHEPVLVVPTGDDAARFERDLCSAGEATLGASIRTFDWLFEDLARTYGVELGPLLSPVERLALTKIAPRGVALRALGHAPRRPRFAPALAALIDELQSALIDPVTLRAAAAELEDGAIELDLADLYSAYVSLRDRAGRGDRGQLAEVVLREIGRHPSAWRRRPVFFYGFDDLTRAQLELAAALAAVTEVTVAVNYADRTALGARAPLLAELREAIGVDHQVELEHDPAFTSKSTLRHLDRCLFEPECGRVEPDDGLALLECASERGEHEAIGLEVARLIAAGVAPDDIAIVLRHPATAGPSLAAVLAELGVPAALEAMVPLPGTGVGGALLALCRAAGEGGTPDDLLAHLRADATTNPGAVDWLERLVRRHEATTVDEAIASWEKPPRHLARLRPARGRTDRLRALARSAREIAEGPHRHLAPLAERDASGPRATPFVPLELRAGVAAAELLEELATVGELPECEPPGLADAIDALEAASIPAWRGPTDGRVRIMSPYRARGVRVRFLFCASLQEGEFPGPGAIDPLLGEERRKALGLSALRRRDPAEEERYLFHACVSRPTERLYLTWRSSDEDGAALARSPFIDEVLDLIRPDSEAAEARLVRRRGPERVVPAPAEAPTERQLARALAAEPPPAREEAIAGLGLPQPIVNRMRDLLTRIPDPSAKPGPLQAEPVLKELAAREPLSANALEGWLSCPYRWFVDHELRPERLERESDPLWLGSVVHDALEQLYKENPGGDSIPRPDDVDAWKTRFAELLAEKAGDPATGERRAALERARVQVEGFLDAEARSPTTLRPRSDLLEWRFGFDEGGSAPPLRLDDLTLRGRIDRIDVAPDGRGAVIRDYKTASKVAGAGAFDDRGALQVPLYIRAVRDLLGLEPIAGIYEPLGATRDRRPRGLAMRDDPRLEGLELVRRGKDLRDAEEFDAAVAAATDRARAAARDMHQGKIDRRPLGGRCPDYCTFQPICRLERALGLESEQGEDSE